VHYLLSHDALCSTLFYWRLLESQAGVVVKLYLLVQLANCYACVAIIYVGHLLSPAFVSLWIARPGGRLGRRPAYSGSLVRETVKALGVLDMHY